MRGRGLGVIALAGVLVVAPARGDRVERRGVDSALDGQINSIDDAGVRLRTESGAEHFVPWDRVRRIEGATETTLDRRMQTAVELWRARTRVERGDTDLAEPLLERLFETYRGQTHETARVVAEGLLRCRLARGANALAVIPALETARLVRADVATRSYDGLGAVLDETTALCPQLAPVWADPRVLGKLERDLAGYDAGGDAVVAAIARAYRRASGRQLGRDVAVETGGPDAAPHAGVKLIETFVAGSDPEPAVRDAARRALAIDPERLAPWRLGWVRFAIGASLLQERGVGQRQRGIVSLLHLPARHRSRLPYLSGLALAWSAEASRADGDATAAQALDEALARLLPNHPVRTVAGPVRPPRREGAS